MFDVLADKSHNIKLLWEEHQLLEDEIRSHLPKLLKSQPEEKEVPPRSNVLQLAIGEGIKLHEKLRHYLNEPDPHAELVGLGKLKDGELLGPIHGRRKHSVMTYE